MKKITKLCIGLTGLIGAITPAVFATSCCLNRKQPVQDDFINVPDTFEVPVVTDMSRSSPFTLPSEGEPMYILDGGSRVNIKDKIDDGSYKFKYEFVNTSTSAATDPVLHENMIAVEFSLIQKLILLSKVILHQLMQRFMIICII